MLAAELSLLSEPIDGVRKRAEELRAFLPTINIDKLVEVRPTAVKYRKYCKFTEQWFLYVSVSVCHQPRYISA